MADQSIVSHQQVLQVLFTGDREALAFGLFVTAQVEGHAHASQSGDMPGAGQVTLLAAAPAVYEENARHFGARADQGAGDVVILDLQFNGFTLNGHVRESAQIC
ncbi:hypothetical protein D3C71_1771820 [compost metagenome]